VAGVPGGSSARARLPPLPDPRDAVAVSDGRAHLDPVADGDDDADAVPNGHGHVHPDSRADRDEDPHAAGPDVLFLGVVGG
jgi:hypothetical protein